MPGRFHRLQALILSSFSGAIKLDRALRWLSGTTWRRMCHLVATRRGLQLGMIMDALCVIRCGLGKYRLPACELSEVGKIEYVSVYF